MSGVAPIEVLSTGRQVRPVDTLLGHRLAAACALRGLDFAVAPRMRYPFLTLCLVEGRCCWSLL